jgi:hypothetical protein
MYLWILKEIKGSELLCQKKWRHGLEVFCQLVVDYNFRVNEENIHSLGRCFNNPRDLSMYHRHFRRLEHSLLLNYVIGIVSNYDHTGWYEDESLGIFDSRSWYRM